MKKILAFNFLFLLALSACQEPPASEEERVPVAVRAASSDTLNKPELPKVDISYLTGKFDPGKDSSFVEIDPRYADREGRYMRKEAYEKFKQMHAAAKAEGIDLKIVSAARNFEDQKSIWEAKWTGERMVKGMNLAESVPDSKERALTILEYSSMPGTSRHHWGTDIDLNNLNNSYFEKGKGKEVYDWLQRHAAEYGYCQPYTAKDERRPDGYNEEKWQLSYLPIAQPLTEVARKRLKDTMISGFKGAEAAVQIGVVEKYVLGINKNCLAQN